WILISASIFDTSGRRMSSCRCRTIIPSCTNPADPISNPGKFGKFCKPRKPNWPDEKPRPELATVDAELPPPPPLPELATELPELEPELPLELPMDELGRTEAYETNARLALWLSPPPELLPPPPPPPPPPPLELPRDPPPEETLVLGEAALELELDWLSAVP